MSKHTRAHQILLIQAVSALFAIHANAQHVSTAVGNGADAFITRSTPTTNFGNDTYVAVKNDSGTGNVDRKGYFRFDLSSVAVPVQTALVSFTYTGNSTNSANFNTYDVYGLVDGHPGEAWSESSVTWANAPANLTNSGTGFLPGEVQHLGSFSMTLSLLTIGDIVPFASPELLTWIQADSDGLVTVILSRQQGNLANEWFASKEDTVYPPCAIVLGTCPGPLGVSFCGPAALNSTGVPGRMNAVGCAIVQQNDLTLLATDLPPGQFGYFIGGQTPGSSQPPGSQGMVCIAPFPTSIIRFNAATQIVTGPSGQISVDTMAVPTNPVSAIQPGDVYYFQCWYRDVGGTSNFTDAVAIAFL